MMDKEVYYEEVPLSQWATIMISIFIIALTPTFLFEAVAVHKEPILLWFYLIMDLFFIVIMLNFRKMTTRITDEKLTASFGVIKKTIQLNDITRCETINATLGVFTGQGIRYGGDGSLAYLPRLEEAIKLSFVSGQTLRLLNQKQ